MAKTDPKVNAGGRAERQAVVRRLRRRIRHYRDMYTSHPDAREAVGALTTELNWMLSREQRFGPKPGGFGRK
jgi:hypothetical protein